MPRIVVTTADGAPLRNLWASNAELVRRVVELIESLPDLPLYIEGEELPREQRASLLIQAAQVREATARTAQDMAPHTLVATYEDLLRGFDELRRMHFQSARDLGLLVQTHNRAVVEDGIRARFLLHQSLDDIDAIDRSVTVARLKRSLVEPRAPGTTQVVTTQRDDGLRSRLKQGWHKRHTGRDK